MPFNTTRNSFNLGWNQDIDPRLQDPSTYRDPKNISITSDGNFYTARNLKGSTELQEIISSGFGATNINILGAFECIGTYYSYGGEEKNKSIIFFTTEIGATGLDKIQLYDTVRDQLHVLLTTSPTGPGNDYSLDFPLDGTVDAAIFGDGNVNEIYFDDHTNPLRNFTITDNALTAKELVSAPFAPVDPITYYTQIDGAGQLPSGSYQFAYRYYNLTTKKFTTWSLLTNPAPVYPASFEDVDRLDAIYGGVANEETKKSIVLKVGKTVDNSDIFDSIQLAVVKHTDGLKTAPTIAYVTDPSEEWYTNPNNIVYNGAGLESVIDIGELTIENACIESAKTLVVKDNVLFRGNIKYSDRDVESVTFTSAETITDSLGLSSDVHLPTTVNTNNPNWTVPSGTPSSGGDFEGAFRIFNEDFDAGGGAFTVDQADALGGTIIDGIVGGATPNVSITVPNNLVTGNEVTIKLRGYPGAATKKDVGDQWLGFANYYEASLRWEGDTTQANSIGATYTNDYVHAETFDGDYYDLDVSYFYVVKPNDTDISIATTILNNISGLISADKAEVTRSGATLTFTNKYTQFTPDVPGITDEPKNGIVDLAFKIDDGVDTSPSDSSTELDDLRDNPDSKEGGYKNPRNVVDRKGYFRDEVYRFGITYQDEHGCWSRPVPFDFSNLKASDVTSYGNTATFLDIDAGENLARVDLADTTLVVGDLLGVQETAGSANDIVFFPISGIAGSGQYWLSWSSEDFGDMTSLKAAWDAETVNFAITRGGEFSHATSGLDWKFPPRENGAFPIIDSADANDLGNLKPLGLRITGISTAPSWAVSYAIVRVKRLIDIVWQSPHIAAMAAMPSISPMECETPTAGGISTGAYGPKILSKGIARNIERAVFDDSSDNMAYSVHQCIGYNNINPISVCVPPEYMMQQDGVNFDTVITPSNAKLEIVDAVALYRTQGFNIDGGGIDLGYNETDRIPLGLRADSVYSYYHRGQDFGASYTAEECRLLLRLDAFDDVGHIPTSGHTQTLGYGEMTNRGAQYTFPTNPDSNNFRLNRLQEFGLEPVSLYNCGQEVIQQKQLVVLGDVDFGEISWYAAQTATSLEAIPAATSSLLRFDVGPGSSSNMNCGRSVFYGDENPDTETSFTGSGTVTAYGDGPSSVVPIVNLKRGIADDRYGDIDDVYQYIFTGTYGAIVGSSPFDVDIWGGDCFITKHSVKVADTSVTLDPSGNFEVFESGADGSNPAFPSRTDGAEPRVFALTDAQEVVSLYLESRVNSDLQADKFIYPVLDNDSLAEFSTDYLYPYNFGYSVENDARVWTSKSITENVNRLEFPARIIYSNERVFQTDIKGFNEFEALSFYDLPEEFGGITKLTKLSNGNVYSIQDSGVSILPINKNVIEDGAGQEIVINSSTLINTPQYLLTKNGSQHIRSVITSEDHLFFMDAFKREVFKIGPSFNGKISDMGLYTKFLNDLETTTQIPDDQVVAGYDFNNNEYWIGVNGFTDTDYDDGVGASVSFPTFLNVWSDKINAWTTAIDIDANTEIKNFAFSRSNNYILGKKADNSYIIEELYTGPNTGVILGETNQSSIATIINPEVVQGKTFDVVRIDSSERVDQLSMTVVKETGVAAQNAVMDAYVNPRHDGYEFPILRDSNGARLRGKYAQALLTMNNGNANVVDIASLTTKFRLSARTFR